MKTIITLLTAIAFMVAPISTSFARDKEALVNIYKSVQKFRTKGQYYCMNNAQFTQWVLNKEQHDIKFFERIGPAAARLTLMGRGDPASAYMIVFNGETDVVCVAIALNSPDNEMYQKAKKIPGIYFCMRPRDFEKNVLAHDKFSDVAKETFDNGDYTKIIQGKFSAFLVAVSYNKKENQLCITGSMVPDIDTSGIPDNDSKGKDL